MKVTQVLCLVLCMSVAFATSGKGRNCPDQCPPGMPGAPGAPGMNGAPGAPGAPGNLKGYAKFYAEEVLTLNLLNGFDVKFTDTNPVKTMGITLAADGKSISITNNGVYLIAFEVGASTATVQVVNRFCITANGVEQDDSCHSTPLVGQTIGNTIVSINAPTTIRLRDTALLGLTINLSDSVTASMTILQIA
jgi:hypothetical protein